MMLSALLLAAFTSSPLAMPAQDPVEFNRLAGEQRQVAEQLRRLESLLGMLEARDREENRIERADMLKLAAARLAASENTGDLAAAVEGLAREIASMHSGNALEAQRELISTLQELLNFLIANEQKEREILQQKSLEERVQALENFIAEQKKLLDETSELKAKSETGESGETGETDESGETDDSAEELEQLRRELAELQSEFADKLEQFNRQQQRESGRPSPSSEKAQDAAEDAAEELREQSAETAPESPSQQLQDAIKQQQEALEKLEQAKKSAEEQLKQGEQIKREEALLNVEMEAQRLLAIHREIADLLEDVAMQIGDQIVPRSTRAKLRQAAATQGELATAAEKMTSLIDQYGADSFPFYIHLLAQDHLRLSKQIGPPRYQVNPSALHISKDLTDGWEQLIDAIRVERERIRRKLEGDDMHMPDGEESAPKKNQPLVDFALELQLLKRMQGSITEQLLLLSQRQVAYQQAGIEMGPEDLAELELLLDRQKDLQLQFESMVDRLSGAEEAHNEEDV